MVIKKTGVRFKDIESMIAAGKSKLAELGEGDPAEVESSEEILADDEITGYPNMLKSEIVKNLKDVADSVSFKETDPDSLFVIVMHGDQISEFEVPYADLSNDENLIDNDIDFIGTEIRNQLDAPDVNDEMNYYDEIEDEDIVEAF